MMCIFKMSEIRNLSPGGLLWGEKDRDDRRKY